MKVLNLCCSNEHRFEGWFGSETDFVDQGERGQLVCPLCDDKTITRLPSAPHLNVSGRRIDDGSAPSGVDGLAHGSDFADVAQMAQIAQGQGLQATAKLMQRTEDVGERFPEEARRIHYGEVARRDIRGLASLEAADALREEGIDVVAMPLPETVKGPLQ